MNKIKLASRFLDNGDEIVEVIIPETRIFVTVRAYEREREARAAVIGRQAGNTLGDALARAVLEQEWT